MTALYDGRDASIKDFPYVVQIERSGRIASNGAIINKSWVVTVGQPFDHQRVNITVRAGTSRRQEGGSLHRVDKIVLHEDGGAWSNGLHVNDVCLVHVAEPFELDETRQPIKLPEMDEQLAQGTLANLSGFGWVRGYHEPETLQWLETPTISCDEPYRGMFGELPDGLVCAGYHGQSGRDACHDDLGAPLVASGSLVGLVSFFHYCDDHYHPGIYTDVSYYREWIDLNLRFD